MKECARQLVGNRAAFADEIRANIQRHRRWRCHADIVSQQVQSSTEHDLHESRKLVRQIHVC